MDTLNDIISGLKWGDLDPLEAHDRVLALFSVRARLNAESMQELINDTYNWQVQDMDADTMEEALKLGIREGVLAVRDKLG